MRNLKRVLTLVMAVAMMMSLLVVGAGAAFPDQNKIENADAVDMNVALGIIKGRDTGDFDPTGNVTRGEMAKMICVALNGGKEPTLGIQATTSYTDIKGHWAQAYIEYCTSLGIVAGMGDGTFNPNGNVTGTQAAKMLLVALGYDAVRENFNGANWSININVRASQKDLYEDLTIDPNAALNRDDAAQMIWNALEAVMVEYEYSLTTVNGQLQSIQVVKDKADTDTLLNKKFKALTQVATMTGYSWNDEDEEFTYDFDGAAIDSFTSEKDYTKLFAMTTKVVYKSNTAKDVYGLFADDSKVLYTGVANDIEAFDSTYIKVDGTKYKTDASAPTLDVIPAFAENQYVTGGSQKFVDDIDAAYTVKVIDNNDNGKVDCVVYLPFTYAQVSSVGSKTVALTGGNDSTSLKFEDDNIYKGIAKDDVVMIIAAVNTAYDGKVVTKMDSFDGKVTGTKTDKVKVNNTWYNLKNSTNPTMDNTYTFYAVGNYIYFVDQTQATSLTDVLFVAKTAATGIKNEAKVYFTDGSSATVTVKEVQTADGTKIASPDFTAGGGDVAGLMYTFTVKNGEYTLTLVGDANRLGFKNYDDDTTASSITAAGDNSYGKLEVGAASYFFADDAVVFIAYDSMNSVDVVTGAVAKNYKNAVAGTASQVLYGTSNGVNKANVAAIVSTDSDLPNSKGQTDNYGYVVSDAYKTRIDGDDYYKFTIWNGTKDVVLYTEDNVLATAREGAIISYTDLGDGEVGDVAVLAEGTLTATTNPSSGLAAVKGISGKSLILVKTDGTSIGEFYLTSDTTYLYMDTENSEGEDTGAINTAIQEGTTYLNNVFVFVDNTDNEIALIVVDTANEWQ